MGDHAAIADAGDSLVGLLRDHMAALLNDPKQIVLASPVDEDLKQTVRLTVYLYDVNSSNNARGGGSPDGVPESDKPLGLELKYLLTAHPGQSTSGTTTTTETMNEHTMLGRAMQVLHDNAILRPPALRGSLAEGDEVLEVSLLSGTTDTVVNIWNTFEKEAYRPSVSYLVTPVTVEPYEIEGGDRVEHAAFEEYLRTGEEDA